MARPLRIEFAGALYHITARGNARGDIFQDDTDRCRFLVLLAEACELFHWHCHAWCLMGNPYHLLLETGSATLSKGMRWLNGVYTQYHNRRHRRVGHLFQGRFKGILVEKESYLLELALYIVLNPVRARMVHEANEWPWSSYRATAGMEASLPCLTRDWILRYFGDKFSTATCRYQQFVREGTNQPAPWEQLKNQVYLGSDAFVERVQQQIDEAQPLEDIPKLQPLKPVKALEHYEAQFPTRDEAMAHAWLDRHYSLEAIGRHFGVSRTTVSRAVKAFRVKREV